MSNNPTCVQCGGREFFVESGFYFCAECQIQSQDIREQVLLSNFQGGTQARTVKAVDASQRADKKGLVEEGPELTSWEVLNYVLKGWVDELISLGVDRKVKIITLQLWVAYLRKLEVAFISTIVKKKPRLGFTFRTRDAELIYGASSCQAKVLKKPFSSRSSASSQGSSAFSSTARFRSKKRKELATALYEEESVVSETSRSNVSLENLSTSSVGSTKSTKMCYTAHAKKTLSKLFGSMENLPDLSHKEVLYRDAQNSEKLSLRHLNIRTIFSLLRLALLICKSPVQLSDMFRWSREGYLSLRDLERLLPPSVKVTKDIKALLVNPVSSWACVTKKLNYLAKYLDVEKNLSVDLLAIIKKLVQELHLPDDIMEVIRKLYMLSKPKLKLSATVNYEGRAVAFIIFILKVAFSLDGQTEIINSSSALHINKCLESNSSDKKKLFNWTEWTKSLEFRDAVVSKYHIPSRELWYPGVNIPETVPAFLGQWSVAPKRQTINRKYEIKACISNSLERILEPFSSYGTAPPNPSLVATIPLIEHAATLDQPDVGSKLMSLLDSSSKYSIAYYFDIERLTELAIDNGCKISFDLPTEFRRIQKHRRNTAKRFSRHIVTVNLSGSVTESDTELDSLSEEYSSTNSGIDSEKISRSKKRKRRKKKFKSRKNIKNEDDSSSEKSLVSSDSIYKHTGQLSVGDMWILPSQNSTIISKIDLEEAFRIEDDIKQQPTIHVVHDNYWVLKGAFYRDGISIEDFEEIAQALFAPSFYWLLRRCSKLIDQSMRDVYWQLLILEDVHTETRRSRYCSRKTLWNKW